MLRYAGKVREFRNALVRLRSATPTASKLATDEVGRRRYQDAFRKAEITGLIRQTLTGGDAA